MVIGIFFVPFIIGMFSEDLGITLFFINLFFIPLVIFFMLKKKKVTIIPLKEKDSVHQIEDHTKESIELPSQLDFSVIDFETANANLNSACSIGIAGVRNNQIVGEFYSLIKPRFLSVDQKNFEIHGISKNDLIDAPSFKDIWQDICEYIQNSKYIVAHNAQFDMSVLNETAKVYNIDVDDFRFVCSMNLCNGYTGSTGNGLDAISKYYEVENSNHHNALNDAKTAAQCVIRTIEISKFYSFDTLVNKDSNVRIKQFKDLKSNKTFGGSRNFHSKKISDFKTSNLAFNENHPFFGKAIVVTGEFKNYSRSEMIQSIVDVGGFVRGSVSKKTDFLIVGEQDKNIVGEDGLSGKQEKAIALIEQGYKISIIDEVEFTKIVSK